MRAHRSILLVAALAGLTLAAADTVFAQKAFSRGQNIGAGAPVRGGGGDYRGGGYRGGWGVVPGVLMAIPQKGPPGGRYIDDDIDAPQSARRPARRGSSGAPAANERRLVPDEVVIEIANSATPQQIDALQRRHRLTRLESLTFQLTGTTLYRWRIPDRRSVAAVVRAL